MSKIRTKDDAINIIDKHLVHDSDETSTQYKELIKHIYNFFDSNVITEFAEFVKDEY